jgi:hypothetical protein
VWLSTVCCLGWHPLRAAVVVSQFLNRLGNELWMYLEMAAFVADASGPPLD